MVVVNGVLAGEMPPRDRGLAYGDGVFRTFIATGGRGVHWHRHYAKLAHDCARLKLVIPEAGVLERDVKAACEAVRCCAVKIVVTRGVGRRGYAYGGDEAPNRIVIADPLISATASDRNGGIKVRLCTLALSHQPALAGVKHLNRLENVLARAEWNDPDIGEGLLRDGEGNVVSGTTTNLFIVSSGQIVTPSLEDCGVAGVTRDRVIDAASRQGISCTVRAVTWDEVINAAELFVVNSLTGIRPVRDLCGQVRVAGALTRLLQRALEQEDDAQTA